MQPEIWECDAYLIETIAGREVIPVNVCGEFVHKFTPDSDSPHWHRWHDSAREHFGDYTEGVSYYSVSRKHGYCYRLSMPGYLDCTDTGFAASELEALEEILSLYGNETGEPEDWEADIESRIAELKQESK